MLVAGVHNEKERLLSIINGNRTLLV